MSLLFKTFGIVGFALSVCFTADQCLAGEVHINRVEIRKENSKLFVFTFYLNAPKLLHPLMAPQLTWAEFVKTYADRPAPEFQKDLARAIAGLSAQSFLVLPSGGKVNLKKWQLPEPLALQESLRVTRMLMSMPASAQAHLEPVAVLAEIQSKTPLDHVQIQLPKAMHPILVNYQNDRFWLTEHIPMAVVSLN